MPCRCLCFKCRWTAGQLHVLYNTARNSMFFTCACILQLPMTTPPPHARTHHHAALWLEPLRACHAHPRRYTNNQSPKPVHLFVTCGRGPSGVEPPHVAVSKVCTELSKILLDGLARPCIVRMDLRSSHLAFAVDRVAIETLVDRLVRSPGVTQISYNRNDFHPLSVAKIYICMVDRCHAPKFRR